MKEKDDSKHLENNLKKAVIEMLLLKLIAEGDTYGYELSQELKKRSSGLIQILEGSMYPILYRLSDNEYISFYEKKVGKRMSRVYYHIEKKGLDYLSTQEKVLDDYIDLVHFLLNSNKDDVYE